MLLYEQADTHAMLTGNIQTMIPHHFHMNSTALFKQMAWLVSW